MTAGEDPDLELDQHLAEVLRLPRSVSRRAAACRLAELAGLPSPNGRAAVRLLAEIVAAVQRDVIDNPDVAMDRMVAAHTATTRGCIRVGEDVVRDALAELGRDAVEWHVHGALESKVAPALARRGAIRLVSEPR